MYYLDHSFLNVFLFVEIKRRACEDVNLKSGSEYFGANVDISSDELLHCVRHFVVAETFLILTVHLLCRHSALGKIHGNGDT